MAVLSNKNNVPISERNVQVIEQTCTIHRPKEKRLKSS